VCRSTFHCLPLFLWRNPKQFKKKTISIGDSFGFCESLFLKNNIALSCKNHWSLKKSKFIAEDSAHWHAEKFGCFWQENVSHKEVLSSPTWQMKTLEKQIRLSLSCFTLCLLSMKMLWNLCQTSRQKPEILPEKAPTCFWSFTFLSNFHEIWHFLCPAEEIVFSLSPCVQVFTC
jgi:hypothetical protein